MPDLLAQLRRTRVLAILRGVPPQHVPKLIETLLGAGIELFEVALSDDLGLPGLQAAHAAFGPDLPLGAGTVVTPELARQAHLAGATFLVTPHLVPEVCAYAREQGVGLLSGAFSPGEVYASYQQGSAAVKVFPAGMLGPEYFRQLRGPYPDVPLLAVGGVDASTVRAYLDAGAVGVGIGGALTRADWSTPDWAALGRTAADIRAQAGEPT